MKKAIFAVVLLALVIVSYLILTKKGAVKKEQSFTVSPSSIQTASPTLSPPATTEKGYEVKWIVVRDIDKISLHSNLKDKMTSGEALKKFGCNQIISGGFWAEGEKHLGLFISDGQKLEISLKSDLLNGFFWIDSNKSAVISNSEPISQQVSIGLQSGPILIKDGVKMPLKIENDEQARRIVLGITNKKEAVFLVFYSAKTPLYGPLLEKLPEYLTDIQKNTSIKLKDAVNLDGGFHSAFISEDAKLTEASTVGSFFCIKP